MLTQPPVPKCPGISADHLSSPAVPPASPMVCQTGSQGRWHPCQRRGPGIPGRRNQPQAGGLPQWQGPGDPLGVAGWLQRTSRACTRSLPLYPTDPGRCQLRSRVYPDSSGAYAHTGRDSCCAGGWAGLLRPAALPPNDSSTGASTPPHWGGGAAGAGGSGWIVGGRGIRACIYRHFINICYWGREWLFWVRSTS